MTGKMKEILNKFKSLPNDEVVLDVRSKEEFAEGHVPGALNIPHDEVAKHIDKLKAYKKIYLHCRSGKRAQLASEALSNAGCNNVFCVDDSGWMDWEPAGGEVEKH